MLEEYGWMNVLYMGHLVVLFSQKVKYKCSCYVEQLKIRVVIRLFIHPQYFIVHNCLLLFLHFYIKPAASSSRNHSASIIPAGIPSFFSIAIFTDSCLDAPVTTITI